MAIFSKHQVRQLYVVTSKDTVANLEALAQNPLYPNVADAGKTALSVLDNYDHPSGGEAMAKAFSFLYANSRGELVSSDIIWRQSIRDIRVVPAAKMVEKLPTWEITLNTAAVPNFTIAANDYDVYFIDFRFPAFQNATEEEEMTKTISFMWKSGNWADAAADAINKAFKEAHNLYNKLVVATAKNATTVEVYAPEGKWLRGIHSNKPNQVIIYNPEIEIFSDPSFNTDPVSVKYRVKNCGTVQDITATTSHTVKNGKLMADIEWFFMGDRADIYRKTTWPDYIKTDYMVDPSKEYDTLEIMYYFQGDGVNDTKSEKHLTLVAEKGTGYLEEFYNEICGNGSQPTPTPEPEPTPTPEPGGDVTEGDVYSFRSYSDAQGTTQYATGEVSVEEVGDEYAKIIVDSNEPDTDPTMVGREFYISVNAVADDETLNELYTDDQGTSANVWVAVKKADNNSTEE